MNGVSDSTALRRVSVPGIVAGKGHRRLAMVTAYDAAFAQMVDQAGADIVLVGDSLGMVVQGLDSTLSVTVDDIVYHCRMVARRLQRAHLVADMPFMSCSISSEQALVNAAKLVQQGQAQSVKIEGGRHMAETVRRLSEAGIPVMGHVGLQPQQVHALGGFAVQGKTAEAAQAIREDARTVAEAGAYAVLMENIPSDLAREITQELQVPTIGIGAGPYCDGQVLVIYDLLGLTPTPVPKFVRPYDNFFERGVEAVQRYCVEVRDGSFPSS